MTLRTGRKVGRTIYKQIGPAPSDDDQLVGVMDTSALADHVVSAVNANEIPGVGKSLFHDLKFIVNYYGVDARTNTSDHVLASIAVGLFEFLANMYPEGTSLPDLGQGGEYDPGKTGS